MTPAPGQSLGAGAGGIAASFARDGFALVRAGADAGLVGAALAHLKSLRARTRLGAGAPIVPALPGEEGAERLAASAGLAGLAGAVLDAPIACFGLTYLCKPARSGLRAAWHQDAGPWQARLRGAAAVTVWVALTCADPEHGGLCAVPGTHRLPAQALLPDPSADSLFGVAMDPSLVETERAVAIPAATGDVVLLHPNLVHGSSPNVSADDRVALVIRYRAAP